MNECEYVGEETKKTLLPGLSLWALAWRWALQTAGVGNSDWWIRGVFMLLWIPVDIAHERSDAITL